MGATQQKLQKSLCLCPCAFVPVTLSLFFWNGSRTGSRAEAATRSGKVLSFWVTLETHKSIETLPLCGGGVIETLPPLGEGV